MRPVHHVDDLSVPAPTTERLEGVLSLSVERGVSVRPAGDPITTPTLDQTVDDVLAGARETEEQGPAAVGTSGADSLAVPGARSIIEDDTDEYPWGTNLLA